MIRSAGAREIHMRISSPPTAWPCFYGIDTPTRQELIAASHSTEEIMRYITADSLGYMSTQQLTAAIGEKGTWCDACFSGNYPIEFPQASLPEFLELGGKVVDG
jgi:amidophosphoribosyltransferase